MISLTTEIVSWDSIVQDVRLETPGVYIPMLSTQIVVCFGPSG